MRLFGRSLRCLAIWLVALATAFSYAEESTPGGASGGAAPQPEATSLVNMTSEPSSIVNSVNAISGDFLECGTDYTVSGPDSYVLGHSYVSSTLEKANLGHGWNFDHPHKLRVFQPRGINFTKEVDVLPMPDEPDALLEKGHHSTHGTPPYDHHNPYTHLLLYEPSGGTLLFKGDGWAGHFHLDHKKTGLTNTSRGAIGAGTNIKNIRVHFDHHNDTWRVTMGDGSVRIYGRRWKLHHKHEPGSWWYHIRSYHIVEEIKPSGNRVLYEYNNAHRIKKIKTVSRDGKKTFNWVSFHSLSGKGWERDPKILVETSDGHRLTFKHKRIRSDQGDDTYVVSRISQPGKPDVHFEYSEKSDHHDRRLEKKRFDDGYYVSNHYYREGSNKIGGHVVHADEAKRRKFLKGRVRMQTGPFGPGGKGLITHRYFYHRQDNGRMVDHTTVVDAKGNRVKYFYDKEERLIKVRKISARGKTLMSERFVWGEKGSKEEGCLVVRTVLDEASRPRFSRVYEYDDRGNIRSETWYGMLTKLGGRLKLHANGHPASNSTCDIFKTTYTYSDDGFNNRLSECDPDGNYTYYRYKKGTNLVTAKFSCKGKEICRREFSQYDDNASCILRIVDDGTTSKMGDFTGVTQRRVTMIRTRRSMPHFGDPREIIEYYVDLPSRRLKRIRRMVNTYNSHGLVSAQDVYDDKNVLSSHVEMRYDKVGRVIYTQDNLGRHQDLEYDESGRLTYHQGYRAGVSTRRSYDRCGRLVREEEHRENNLVLSVRHDYNILGQKVCTTDHHGISTWFTYDGLGRLVHITYPRVLDTNGQAGQSARHIEYSKLGTEVTETDENGAVTKTIFNAKGQVLEKRFPDGTLKRCTYDSRGNIVKETAPNGVRTVNEYDHFGRPTSSRIEGSDGTFSLKRMTYNTFQLLKEEGPTGEKALHVYDQAGRKTKTVLTGPSHNKQRVTTYHYDSMGRILEERCYADPSHFVRKHREYDSLGRLIAESEEDKDRNVFSTATYGYDQEGNRTSVTRSVMGRESKMTMTYHPHGVPHKVVDAEGNVTITEYDYFHVNRLHQKVLKKTTVDPLGVRHEEEFDARGRLVLVTSYDPIGRLIAKKEQFYDHVGNLTRIDCSAVANEVVTKVITTRLTYGPNNRLESLIEAFGASEQKETRYVYNELGQQAKVLRADGSIVHTRYDEKGRVSQFWASDESVDYVYVYDASDRIVEVINRLTLQSTKRTYDDLGELISERLENGLALAYDYDWLGRLTELTLSDGSSVSYHYSGPSMQKIVRLDQARASLWTHEIGRRDRSGKIMEATLPGRAGTISYDYDRNGRSTKICHPHFSQDVPEAGYDPVGNLLLLNTTDGQGGFTSNFAYDYLSQLTHERGHEEHRYSYDSLHRRLSYDDKPYTVNDLHAVLDDSERHFTYDATGNRIAMQSADHTTRYRYDALDRLTLLELSDTSRVRYSYDAFSRRTHKTHEVLTDGMWREERVERYLYAGEREIGLVDSNDTIQELRILGEGIGAELAAAVMIECEGLHSVPLHDHRGNVVALIDPDTGDLREHYRYTAFGLESIYGTSGDRLTSSAFGNPWRFSSKRVDAESGLIYFGRRYYDPTIGSWLTQDPLGIKAGPNLYAYVLNNPMTHFDLYGLEPERAERGPIERTCDFVRSCFDIAVRAVCDIARGVFTVAREVGSFAVRTVADCAYTAVTTVLEHGPQIGKLNEKLSNGIRAAFGKKALERNNSEVTQLREGEPVTNQKGDTYTDWGHGNGVNCLDGDAVEGAEACALPNIPLYLCYNSTAGSFGDMFEIGLGLFGVCVEPAAKLRQWMVAKASACIAQGPRYFFIVSAHSQGALNFSVALRGLSDEQKARIIYIGFGGAKITTKEDGVAGAINYISRSDPVPLLGSPLRFAQELLNPTGAVHFVGGFGIPFSKHALLSSDYREAMKHAKAWLMKGEF